MIKLKIGDYSRWQEHRSGWGYVMDILLEFNDDKGIFFDANIDISFSYQSPNRLRGLIPYKESWIGFLHSAVKLCPFMHTFLSLDAILRSQEFKRSLKNCQGLFTFSNHVAKHIKEVLNNEVEIISVKHPTEFPDQIFNFNKFLVKKKTVLHIGNWLRKVSSFLQLNANNYQKLILLNPATLEYIYEELSYFGTQNIAYDVRLVEHVDNDQYDELLTKCIVFLDLCDSNVTNTILECIVRNTPILVNKTEAVIEYLGKDYPFYFNSLAEAEYKLKDIELIYQTNLYLKKLESKNELTREYFIESFLQSNIIQKIREKQNH